MKDQLVMRWNSFSDKEKSILFGLALLMMSLLFYAFVWLPVQDGRERLMRIIPEKQTKLLLMRSQAADIERLRGQYRVLRSSPDKLKAMVEVSAKLHGLVPTYSPIARVGQLEVTLAQVSFDAWVKWLESLQIQNHVRVTFCRITPSAVAGQVRIDASLVALE